MNPDKELQAWAQAFDRLKGSPSVTLEIAEAFLEASKRLRKTVDTSWGSELTRPEPLESILARSVRHVKQAKRTK
jgi:hypothetical protein